MCLSCVKRQTNKQNTEKQDNDRPDSGKNFTLDVVELVVDRRVQAVGLVLHRGLGWTKNAQVFFCPLSTLVSGVPLAPIFAGMVGVSLVTLELHGVDDLGLEWERQGLD